MKKSRKALLSVLAVLLCIMLPLSASAYGPSVLFSPSGECSRPYCVTYVKSGQLPNCKLLATFEDNIQPAETQTFPIFSSTDNGKTWAKTSSIPFTGPRQGWIN